MNKLTYCFLTSGLLLNFWIQWYLNFLNLWNISTMLNKCIIQWFLFNVTTSSRSRFVRIAKIFIKLVPIKLFLKNFARFRFYSRKIYSSFPNQLPDQTNLKSFFIFFFECCFCDQICVYEKHPRPLAGWDIQYRAPDGQSRYTTPFDKIFACKQNNHKVCTKTPRQKTFFGKREDYRDKLYSYYVSVTYT